MLRLFFFLGFLVRFECSGSRCLEACGDGGLCTGEHSEPLPPSFSCFCDMASPGTYATDPSEAPTSCRFPRDHCASSPCRAESSCVSTLGGYFCRCENQQSNLSTYGKDCQYTAVRRDGFEYAQGVYAYFKTVPEINRSRELYISFVKPGTSFKMIIRIPDDHRESVFFERDMILLDVKAICKTYSYSFIDACKYIKEGLMKTVRITLSKSSHVIDGQKIPIGQRLGRLKNVTVEIYNAGIISYSHSYNVLVNIDHRAMKCLPKVLIKECSLNKSNPTKVNKCKPTEISLISPSRGCKHLHTAAEVIFEGDGYLRDRSWTSLNNIQIPDDIEIGKIYGLRVYYYKIGGPPKLPYNEFLTDQNQCWLLIEPCKNVTELEPEKSKETENGRSYVHGNHSIHTPMKGKVKQETRREEFSSDAKEIVIRYLKLVNPENGEFLPSDINGNPLDFLISHLKTNPDDLQPSYHLNVSLEETIFRLVQSLHNIELEKDDINTSSKKLFKIIDELIHTQFINPVNRSDSTIKRSLLEFEMKEEETRSINIIKHISKVEFGILKNINLSEKVDFSDEHYGMVTTMNTINELSSKSLNIPGDSINSIKLAENEDLKMESIMKVAFTKFDQTLLNWSEKVTKSPIIQVATILDDEIVEDIPVEVTLKITPDDITFSGTVKGLIDSQVEDKSEYVTIHKFVTKDDEADWGLIHFKFTGFTSPLKIKCFFDILPEYHIINTTDIIINNTMSEYQFVAYNASYDSILYLGVITEGSVESVNYNLEMNNAQCLVWGIGNWMDGSCKVKYNSNNGTITCSCNHTSIFSASMFTPPHLINPTSDISLFRFFWDNPFIAIVVTLFLIALVILLIWGRYKDEKEIKKKGAELLADSAKGNFPYLIGVYTETYFFAGTSSNVCIKIFGSQNESMVHHLCYKKGKVLQVGQDDWFYIFTEDSLGKIKEIEIFHNDVGVSPDWFCKKIIIYDVTNKSTYVFEISSRISIVHLNKKNVLKYRYKGKRVKSSEEEVNEKDSEKILSNFVIGLRTTHTWLSIFVRHPRSLYTRCQLIMCASTMLFFGMLLSMMFHGALSLKREDTPAVELTIAEYVIAIESFVIALPVAFIIMYLFERPMRLMIEKESAEFTKESKIQTKLLEVAKNKLTSEIQSFPLLPVSLSRKRSYTKNQQIWLAVAWTVSTLTVLICAFFMIFYSLKLGRNKSLLWLMSFSIGWVHDVFFFQPLYIVFFSFLLGFFFQKIASVDKFDFVIVKMKQSKLSIAQAILLRKNNPIYRPLDVEEVKVHQEIREKMEFFNWFFLRLMTSVLFFVLVALMIVDHVSDSQQIDLQQTRRQASNIGIKGKGLEKVYNQEGMLEFLKAAIPRYCSMSRDPEEVTTNGICTRYSPRVIGIPRLRQQRVRPNTTHIPKVMKGTYTEADAVLNYFTEDTRTFLFGWILPDQRQLKSRDKWQYYNHLALKTTSTFVKVDVANASGKEVIIDNINVQQSDYAVVNDPVIDNNLLYTEDVIRYNEITDRELTGTTLLSYNGGGYVQELGFTQEESREILHKLERYNWIDKCTRAIFLEYNLYNPSTNRYILVTVLAERFREGVYTVKLHVDGEKIWHSDFGIHFYFLCRWGMFVVLYMISLIQLITNISNEGIVVALTNSKIIIDILCLFFGAYAMTSNLTRILYFKFYIEEYLAQTEEKFVSFRYTMNEKYFFESMLGIFVIVLGLKIIYIFSDTFIISYFRGLLFIRPNILLALFIFVFYINSFFNLFTQICGCPSYPSLITFFYDRTHMSKSLNTGNLYRYPWEYYLTVLYGFIFILIYLLIQATFIGYHSDVVIMSDKWDNHKYQLKKYSDILFQKCKLYLGYTRRPRQDTYFSEIEENNYRRIYKKKRSGRINLELLDYFLGIENSIEKRVQYLTHMSNNIDKMLYKLNS